MSVLNWNQTNNEQYTFIEFELTSDLLSPSDLKTIDLPSLDSRRHLGLIVSGRGPLWLYGHLLHRAHTFAWVAVFDPRLQGGVVVMNHLPHGPIVGTVVPIA